MEAAEEDLNHLIVQGKAVKLSWTGSCRGSGNSRTTGRTGELYADVTGIRNRCCRLIRQGQSVRASEPVMTLVPEMLVCR